MTLRDNPLASFGVIFGALGLAIVIAHRVAQDCVPYQASQYAYHFVFAPIMCFVAGLTLSVVACISKDKQGKSGLLMNGLALVAIIIGMVTARVF